MERCSNSRVQRKDDVENTENVKRRRPAENRTNKPAVVLYGLLGIAKHVYTYTHTCTHKPYHSSVKKSAERRGSGWVRGGEGGEDCGRERQEERERRSGACPGELQTAVTQHALTQQGLGD